MRMQMGGHGVAGNGQNEQRQRSGADGQGTCAALGQIEAISLS